MIQAKKLTVVSQYYPAVNRLYAGIPFIELWRHELAGSFERVLHCPISYRASDRNLDAVTRRQMIITNFMRFFWCFPRLANNVQNLFDVICASYVARAAAEQDQAQQLLGLNDFVLSDAMFRDFHGDSVDPFGGAWLGTPGCSKTSLIRKLAAAIGMGVFHHIKFGAVYQLFMVHVVCPNRGDTKALMQNIFLRLREAARTTGKPFSYGSGAIPSKEADLVEAIALLAAFLNLGALVLDEVQHLFQGTHYRHENSMRSLTTTMAALRIPTLMLGTWDALPGLSAEGRIARRSVGVCEAYFRRLRFGDDEFNTLLAGVWRLNYAEQVSLDEPGVREAIYFWTQGLPDLIIKLCGKLQLRSIFESKPITLALINEVGAEWTPILGLVLSQLRVGKAEKDIRVWDIEPKDLEEYLTEYSDRLEQRKTSGSSAKSRLRSAEREAQQAVAEALKRKAPADPLTPPPESSSDPAPASAMPASPSAASPPPGSSAPAHAAPSVPPGPLPPARSKRLTPAQEEKFDVQFAELDTADLRRLYYDAGKAGVPVLTALEGRAHVIVDLVG